MLAGAVRSSSCQADLGTAIALFLMLGAVLLVAGTPGGCRAAG
jgi:cell division protein FtsW (lipid II flippase)